MMDLLDTDIMIDITRGDEQTLGWFESLEKAPALPGFVVLELIDGCKNRREVRQVESICDNFEIYWPTEKDCNRAIKTFMHCYLAHGSGLIDILIGETAVGLKATLYTFNYRHFKYIPNLTVKPPYEKSVGYTPAVAQPGTAPSGPA